MHYIMVPLATVQYILLMGVIVRIHCRIQVECFFFNIHDTNDGERMMKGKRDSLV